MTSKENLLPVENPRRLSVELVLLGLICAGWILFISSLPLFPSQDGPMHMYYAHVMQALFSKQPTVYSRFYTIKHLLPPYAIYYYALIGLGRFVPLVTADKIVICCYVVSFLFGFRYLARTIGPGADTMALIATLVLINWPLGMGFLTFCGSLSLALWCLGLYVRGAGRADPQKKWLFVLLAWLVMLAHPVPLLTVIGYCALDLLLRGGALIRQRQRTRPQHEWVFLKQDGVYVLLAMSSLLYVRLFTTAHPLQQIVKTEPLLQQVMHNVLMYVKGRGITPFGGMTVPALPARMFLLTVLPLSLGLAAVQCWRNYRSATSRTLANRWLFLAVLILLVMPFLPHDINASHFVADRLMLFVWVAALLAGSAFATQAWSIRLTLILFALAGNFFIWRAAEVYIRPAASELVQLEAEPITHNDQVGLMVDSDWNMETLKFGPLFNSYAWAGASYFRHNNAVLYNTPWLDLTNIPLGAQWSLPTGVLSSSTLEDPNGLRVELLSDPKEREYVLSSVQFVLVDRARARSVDTNPFALSGAENRQWSEVGATDWYTVWNVKPVARP